MNLAPRQQYGLGSLVKSVKNAVSGAAKGVKSFVKSDIGKMALLAAGGFYAGGGSLFGAQRAGMSGFQFGNLPGASFFSGIGKSNIAQQALGGDKGMSGLTKGLLTGGALASIFASQGISDEQAEEIKQNPAALRGYLTQYYKNLNQGAKPEEVNQFVETNMAEYKSNGGRIGAMYGGRMKLEDGTLDPRIREIVMDLMDNEGFEFGEAVKEAYRRVESTENKANGGRMGYAYGSNDLVDQASGIMNLPKRVNNAGVKELDLRDSGGFIPPVGVKEKADDVPAMLSNNEFVFTADAVREFGDGNVNKGAQRMYDMMKKLEKGGRV